MKDIAKKFIRKWLGWQKTNKNPESFRILISCTDFSHLSGSPMYVYTLAKELVTLGNEVTIYSATIGGVITKKAREAGVEVIKKLDKKREFDVMHLNQKWSAHVLGMYDIPAVYTIHSEFECEDPIRDPRIKKYIAIRPSIAQRWEVDAEIIYNPIDFSRFHKYSTPKKELTLFVGTIDPLRKQSALHLINSGKNCRFVGQKFDTWADGLDNWYPATWDIEKHLKEATETAGVMLGRTTLEGFACGLPAIIYDVDEQGDIKSFARHEAPEDMSKFDSKLVAKDILNIYHSVVIK